MAKLSLQLHAEPDELRRMLRDCLPDMELYFAAEEYFPEWRVRGVAGTTEDPPGFGAVNRVTCALTPIRFVAAKSFQYVTQNAGSLFTEIGSMSDGALDESMISSVSEDRVAIKVWKSVLSQLRRCCLRGASVVNPDVGLWAWDPHHAYTSGALKLYEHGVVMRQGSLVFALGEENPDSRRVPGVR